MIGCEATLLRGGCEATVLRGDLEFFSSKSSS